MEEPPKRPLGRGSRTAVVVVAASIILSTQGARVGQAPEALGDLTLVSTVGLRKGNSDSLHPMPSADGGRIVFWSFSNNLSRYDTDHAGDVYVKFIDGKLALASTSDAGVKGNGESSNPSISGDGRKVAFESIAADLDPADPDTTPDVYVKDLVTGDLTLVSTTAGGLKGNGASRAPALSPDGKRVAFHTYATNFDPRDTDAGADVYVKDLVTGDLTLVSTSDRGVEGNRESAWPVLSWNGATVAFWSTATNLDQGDRDPLPDIFVKDLRAGHLSLASTSTDGTKGNGASLQPSLSWDGTRVAFWSEATNLDPADQDLFRDAFVKDLVTGALTLASTSTDGVKGNGHTEWPRISGDGTTIAFGSSATNLDPIDPDASWDVYVKSLVTGVLTLLSVSEEGVKGNGSSFQVGITYDGVGITFVSESTNLDGHDPDATPDAYFTSLPPP